MTKTFKHTLCMGGEQVVWVYFYFLAIWHQFAHHPTCLYRFGLCVNNSNRLYVSMAQHQGQMAYICHPQQNLSLLLTKLNNIVSNIIAWHV